jgi:hypothetical protein
MEAIDDSMYVIYLNAIIFNSGMFFRQDVNLLTLRTDLHNPESHALCDLHQISVQIFHSRACNPVFKLLRSESLVSNNFRQWTKKYRLALAVVHMKSG